MVRSFFPRSVDSWIAGLEETKNLSEEKILRLIQIRFSDVERQKAGKACQAQSPGKPMSTDGSFFPNHIVRRFRSPRMRVFPSAKRVQNQLENFFHGES